MTATLKTVTLGCKVNQYETQYVREGLLSIGFSEATTDQTADLCVVNTCTVTAEGDSKSRQIIRRLARENPGTQIVVMGCYATRAPDEVAALPGVVQVVTDKRELPDLLGRFGVRDIPDGISRFGDRSRAYIKVQDGCMLRCSYCIIPKVRPQLTSRPINSILDEVRRLVANGYRELVLTGVHLGHYGVDWNWHKPKSDWIRLADLVRQIAQLDGDFRIRLSSIEATEVTRELLQVMADDPAKICPHLHVCLQSGSDTILRRMRRRWSTRLFVDRCRLATQMLDLPALTTDVIVGFPGETEADFEQTCRVVQEVGFSKIHVFPFSLRQGTAAAQMPDQVPRAIRAQRGQRIAEIERDLRERYFRSLLGRRLRVLVESTSDPQRQQAVGTSCRYAPVELTEPSMAGRLVDVRAEQVIDGPWIRALPI
ncbi:MAG: tRNA (N(6)-L-threonylcarbamoyladenosine(37)-C(2))-methylthiotransferase MtaB [Planctomycetaceae bacterium]|nr:MAG: tRNA (N(6)-L-threonylcarbamoyladenosine(37)-C(2))-methylthiotransferase MtaB [Planctomycetaceae bacterium]